MNFNTPLSPDEVEPLVRDYLESADESAPVKRVQAKIEARLASGIEVLDEPVIAVHPSAQSWRHSRRMFWRGAIAASLLIGAGFAGYLMLSPDSASAYALVSAASTKLSHAADRCYRIESHVPKGWARRVPFLFSGEETILWTRGDRYRVITIDNGKERIWGQDPNRRLWIANSNKQGLRFDRDDTPVIFNRARSFLGMDLRLLANRFLDDCDLQVERSKANRARGTIAVRATPKEGRNSLPFTEALMEIEAKSKVIRRMELTRAIDGGARGSFVFTLVDEEPRADASYTLEGNIDADAEILDASRAAERTETLRSLMRVPAYL